MAIHQSQLTNRLTGLAESVKQILPGLPGFQSLEIYGSLGHGYADAYSDIDVGVTTDDLSGAKACLLDLLEQIGPIDFCWEINIRPDGWIPTIAFANESLYHRLDVKLRDPSGEGLEAPTVSTHGAYVPLNGSIGHFLLGEYIGCLRYLKARKRGQTMTCYRFAAAAVERQLSLRYARLIGDPGFRSKLSTMDYKDLDRLLPAADRDAFLPDLSSPTAMDRALLSTMDARLADGLHMAAVTGEVIPTDVFDRIRTFVADELQPF